MKLNKLVYVGAILVALSFSGSSYARDSIGFSYSHDSPSGSFSISTNHSSDKNGHHHGPRGPEFAPNKRPHHDHHAPLAKNFDGPHHPHEGGPTF